MRGDATIKSTYMPEIVCGLRGSDVGVACSRADSPSMDAVRQHTQRSNDKYRAPVAVANLTLTLFLIKCSPAAIACCQPLQKGGTVSDSSAQKGSVLLATNEHQFSIHVYSIPFDSSVKCL